MLVVATRGSSRDRDVRSVLARWSGLGLLDPFLWCEATGGQLMAALVGAGQVDERDLSLLLANRRDRVTLLGLDYLDNPDSSEPLSIIGEHLALMADDDLITAKLTLVVAQSVTDDVSTLERPYSSGRVILWPAIDNADPSRWSTPLPGSLDVRAAHAIAAVGGLWCPGREPDLVTLLEGASQAAGRAFTLGRSYTRLLVMPDLRPALFDHLAVEGDEVPKPAGGFERIDLASAVPALAEHFVAGRHALELTDLGPYLLDDSPPSMAFTIREALRALVNFVREIPLLFADEAIDAVVAQAHDRLARRVEKLGGGEMHVYRWSELEAMAPTSGPTNASNIPELDLSEVTKIIGAADPHVAELWESLWRATFSLVDGGDFDWGDALPSHDADHRPISPTRATIVGVRADVTSTRTSDEDASDEVPESTAPLISTNGSTNNPPESTTSQPSASTPATAGLTPLSPDDELPPVFLEATGVLLARRITEAQKELEAALVTLNAADAAIEEAKANAEPQERPRGLARLWRRRHASTPPTPVTKTRRHGVRGAIHRIFVVGALFAAVTSTVVAFLVNPLAGIVSGGAIVISTLAMVIRRLWAERLRRQRLRVRLAALAAARANAIMRIAVRKGDVSRLSRRQEEFRTWRQIIHAFTYEPWRVGSLADTVEPVVDFARPLSFVVARARINESSRRRIRSRFEQSILRPGWIGTRFDAIRSQFLAQIREEGDGVVAQLTPESDRSRDPTALRYRFAETVHAYCSGDESVDDLRERADEFVAGLPVAEVVDEIEIAPVLSTAPPPSDTPLSPLEPVNAVADFFDPFGVSPIRSFPDFLFDRHALLADPGLDGSSGSALVQSGDLRMDVASLPTSEDGIRTPWILIDSLQLSRPVSIENLARSSAP